MKTLREYIDQLDEISRRDFLKGAGAAAVAGAAGYKLGQDSSSKNPYTVDSLTKDDLTAIDTFLTWYAIVKKIGKPRANGSRDFDAGLETSTLKDLAKVYGNDFVLSRLKPIQNKILSLSDQELEQKFNYFWNGPGDKTQQSYVHNKLLPDYNLREENVEQDMDEAATPDAVARIEQLVQYK